MLCNHYLVGRDHVLSIFHRGSHYVESLFGVVDKLNHEVDGRVVQDVVLVESKVRHGYPSLLVAVLNTNPYYIRPEAAAAVQYIVETLSDASVPEQSYSEFFSCHDILLNACEKSFIISSICSMPTETLKSPGSMPAACCSSAESWACVVVDG